MDLKGFPEEKGPVKKDDVDFMGIKKEKILDLSPIGIGLRFVARCVGFEQEAPFCLCHAPAASDGFSY
jgi:hypothetical protein